MHASSFSRSLTSPLFNQHTHQVPRYAYSSPILYLNMARVAERRAERYERTNERKSPPLSTPDRYIFHTTTMSANPWAGEAYVQAGHYDRVVTLALNAGVITQRTPEPDASASLHPSLQLIGTLDDLSALTDRLAELSGDVQDEFFFRQTMDLIDMASIGELMHHYWLVVAITHHIYLTHAQSRSWKL